MTSTYRLTVLLAMYPAVPAFADTQDEYDDDDDDDDTWKDGEGDPCPGCGRLYRSVVLPARHFGCC